jgi:carbamoyltransferase
MRAGIPELLAQHFPGEEFRGQFHKIEHHLAHLYSAFNVSPSKKQMLFQSMVSEISRARLGE